MDIRGRERRLRALAVLVLLVLGGYQAVATGMFIEQLRWPENVVIAGFAVGAPWPSATSLSPTAAKAGLETGDRLLTVQDVPFHGRATVDRAMEKLFPGDRIRLTIQKKNGEIREISWQLEALENGPGHAPFIALMSIGMPLLCLAVGFWTVFARPRDPQAWLLLGMLATFAQSVVHPGAFASSLGTIGDFFHLFHTFMNGAWALFMFFFAWVFPRRTPWQLRSRWLPWAVGLLLAACIVALVARAVLTAWASPAGWGWLIDALGAWMGLVQLIQMLAIGGFFALLTYKRYALNDADSRKRLRTILLGGSLALTPLFLLLLWSLAQGKRPGGIAEMFLIPAILALCLFPLTLGYVIVVHRAFGFGVVLRQGLQYALARRGVRVLQVLLILSVMLTAVVLASQPGMNRPRILQVVGLGTLLVVVLQKAAERLSGWVDRRFFREAYNTELVLANLSDDVRTMVETKPLLEAVATRIGQALHVDRIALLLREGAQFQPAYAIGSIDGGGAPLPGTARTAEVMRRDRAPLRVYHDDT